MTPEQVKAQYANVIQKAVRAEHEVYALMRYLQDNISSFDASILAAAEAALAQLQVATKKLRQTKETMT
jgi:hypothetical protein